MTNNEKLIPLRIAHLICGVFSQKITAEEQIELDNWINIGFDNQQLFEAFLEAAARAVRSVTEKDKSEDFRYIADLFLRKVKKTITPQERALLDQWKLSTNTDPGLLKSFEESSSNEILFERIKMHFYNMKMN